MRVDKSVEQEVFTKWVSLPERELLRMTVFYASEVRRTYPHATVMFVNNRRGERTNVGIFNAPLDLNHKLNFDSRKQASPQLLGRLFDYADNYPEIAKQRIICEAWMRVVIKIIYGESHKSWELSCDGIQR